MRVVAWSLEKLRVRVRVRVVAWSLEKLRVRVRVRVVAWSLEKRATTRPSGVVSKKAIGARSTADSMPLWMVEAARSSAYANVQSRPTEKMTVASSQSTYLEAS